jgi:hypothetical protein
MVLPAKLLAVGAASVAMGAGMILGEVSFDIGNNTNLLALAIMFGPGLWMAAHRLIPNKIKTEIVATTDGKHKTGGKPEFSGDTALGKSIADIINQGNKNALDERIRVDTGIAERQRETLDLLKMLHEQSLKDWEGLRQNSMNDIREWRRQAFEDQRQINHWIRNIVQMVFARLNLKDDDIPEPPKHHDVSDTVREQK